LTSVDRSKTLPEELAVVQALSKALALNPREANRALLGAEKSYKSLQLELARVQQASDQGWWQLTGALLARWPILDDPYHPQWQALIATEGEEIRHALETWPVAIEYRLRQARELAVQTRLDALDLKTAGLERLVRAADNLELAVDLKRRGGPKWTSFLRLRACERGETP